MKRPHGYTLIEVAIVIAIISILATITVALSRTVRGNAGTSSAAYDLVLRLQGLKNRALTDQKEYVLVLLNPKDGDASGCRTLATQQCLRWYLLSSPEAGWTLNGFSAASPQTNISVEDVGRFERDVALDFHSSGAVGPVPFNGVKLLDASIKGTCQDEDGANCDCVAVSFRPSGDVNPVLTAVPGSTPTGMAFGLTGATEANRTSGTSRRAILISSPTGIVKSYLY